MAFFNTGTCVGLSRIIWTPLKLVHPEFWNIWTHSEKFVLTIGQPHKRKSVTTKDVCGVHSCISRKMNHCFSWVCLSGLTQRSKRANFAQCTRKLSVASGREWDYSTLRAAELTGLSSLQKPRKPPSYATGSSFTSEICSASMFFHLWEVVQIFQTESIFCSKISSGGSLYIEKLVPGGTNFGGSIFTMTGPRWSQYEGSTELRTLLLWLPVRC